jgi:hypothetical protein
MTPDPHNLTFQLAADYINGTSQSVFLTGRAGTGKTTFLKHIKQHTPKQHMVMAPTGVAAINAGGTTLHSFFQLPFSPFLPVTDHNNLAQASSHGEPDAHDAYSIVRRVRFNRDKRELLQSLELVIIDEISMVRADVIDAIDTLLRYFRHRPSQPFGGVQMLFIGDMYQLPPVVPNEDWNILRHYYASPFFFDSQVLKQDEPIYIELDKIYRQTDQHFIDALNQVRNNALDHDGFERLHGRYQPQFVPPAADNYVTLCSHNAGADAINDQALQQLTTPATTYTADIRGEFSERSYPADPVLTLKVSAQVMFIKNDLEKPRRFFNGKIGVVKHLTDEEIVVRCPNDEGEIRLGREAWTNVQYTLNRQEHRIEEKELGSFKQFPLRLAWAITIHKSQGLTFEKAIIDAGKAFAPGQVYVALSRCTNLEGMVLRSAIPASAVFTDPRIVAFGQRSKPAHALVGRLQAARFHYQLALVKQCFDGQALLVAARQLPAIVVLHAAGFNAEALPWAQQFAQQCADLATTAQKFAEQIEQLASPPLLPEKNAPLQERIKKAAVWFAPQLQSAIESIKQQPGVTDSKDKAQTYEEGLAAAYKAANQWLQLASACQVGFNAENLLKARSKVQIADVVGLAYAGSNKRRKEAAHDHPHPELLRQLRQLRDSIASDLGMPIYLVAGTQTIDQMARFLPQNLMELRKLSGFGDVKVAKFGNQFLDLILDYCQQGGHEGQMQLYPPKAEKQRAESTKPPKGSSKADSLQRFLEGETLGEIAAARNLAPSTIEGHLATFVSSGELPLEALVDPDTQARIEAVLLQDGAMELGVLRSKLPDVSYPKLKLISERFQQNEAGELKGAPKNP